MEQYWPGPDYEDPDQYWPDVPSAEEMLGTAFHSWLEAIKSAFSGHIIVSREMGKHLAAAGFHMPISINDEISLYHSPPLELREAAAGFKKLKSGRDMPIVLRGSGPQKDQYRRRGRG